MLNSVTLNLDFSEKTIGQAICALLNGSGGFIKINLPKELDEYPDKLVEKFRKDIEPTCIFYTSYPEKNIWLIEVPSLLDQPYGYKDEVFILDNNNEVIKASFSIFRSMFRSNSLSVERWERLPSMDLKVEDLDFSELEKVLAAQQLTDVPKTYQDIANSLYSWSLTKNGKLTNGADICLGKKPNIRLPQASIRIFSYETKVSDSYDVIKEISLPACQLIEATLEKILNTTELESYVFDDSATRKKEHIYPAMAVKEALVNAIAHRDYSKYSGGIQVHIDKFSLRITNTGNLPEGLNSKMLENPNMDIPSIIHNPNIANFLYEFDYMERSGRGSKKILQACQDMGIKVNWEANTSLHTVAVVFKLPTSELNMLSDNMQNIIIVLDGKMSRAEIQKALSIKDNEYFRKAFILPALEAKLIAMTLPDKPTSKNQQYFLTDKGQEFKRNL